MQSYCIFPLKQNQKVMPTSFTAHFTAHSLSRDDESTGISSPTRNASLPAFLPNSILQASLLRPHKQKHLKANPVPSSYMQNPENTSHLLVTSAHPQSGNLPFWPHPPTHGPITFIPISDPPLPGGDEIAEKREDLMEVLCFPEEISARECQVKDGLSLTERQQLKKIREELEITIDEESTSVGEIYEAPEVPLAPFVELECNRNSTSINRNILSSNHGAVQNQKQRIRWTTELHELFIEAVNKLGGPENATPKGILMLMKVDGLNIYHVKSHLQKYRLAKKVRLELKHDKWASSSKEKMQASSENNSDLHIEREAQLETQRMQIELQKLLHEQLKDLQKSIERQGEQLKKILEQQEKPGSNLFPLNGFPTSNLMSESDQALLCSFAGTSANQERY